MVRVVEEHGLRDGEDLCVERYGLGSVGAGGIGYGDGRNASHAVERREDQMVCDVEADCSADADFGRLEEREPEGEHSTDEVYKGGFPVSVEYAEWDEDVPHGCYDDGG